MTDPQRSLHGWLCINSGEAIDQLWTDLEILHRTLPDAYKHLPQSKADLERLLLELEAEGLAAMQNDGGWKYKAERKRAERSLF